MQVIIVLTTQRLNDSLFELFAPYRLRKTFGASISVSPSILSLALSPHWIRKSRVRYTRSSALHGHVSTELEQWAGPSPTVFWFEMCTVCPKSWFNWTRWSAKGRRRENFGWIKFQFSDEKCWNSPISCVQFLSRLVKMTESRWPNKDDWIEKTVNVTWDDCKRYLRRL